MTKQRSRSAASLISLKTRSPFGIKAPRNLLGAFAVAFLFGGVASMGVAQSEAPTDPTLQEVTTQSAEAIKSATGVKRGSWGFDMTDITLDLGSYQFKGIEGGAMAAASIFTLSESGPYPKAAILLEGGLHRARWIYHHVEYNRFAATGDFRLDVHATPLLTPYAAFGVGQHREWLRKSKTAASESYMNLRVGSFINLSEGFAARIDFAPTLGSIRLGGVNKL